MYRKLENRSFLLVLALVTVLFFYLLRPFFGVIFWACVVAMIFYPMQQRLLQRWPSKPNTMALITLFACLFILVVPTLFVLGSVVKQGMALYETLQDGKLDPGEQVERVQEAFPVVGRLMQRFNVDLGNLREQFAGAALAVSRFVAQHAVQVGQGTLQFFINLALMLYVTFFLLRDGRKLVVLLVRALPLGDDREYRLFGKFTEVTRATVKGNLVVALVQGSLGGLIFWIMGIPAALLWGVVMTLLSMIPVVGAGLVWGPVAIYFAAEGEWARCAILSAYGVFVIGLVDNVLRPLLVGRDTKLPDYLVLLSTLGGFAVFGMSGFVMGPLIAALFITFWDMFVWEFNQPATVPNETGSAASSESSESV